MPKHQIMDRQLGHDTKIFEKADVVGVKEAEGRFNELVGKKKYLAIKPSADGSPGTLLKAFDPDADIVFQPALQGG